MAVWPYTTKRWERLRQHKMRRDPLCEACLQHGQIVPAEAVDHRRPISKQAREQRLAAEAFPPLDDLASLCASHHNAKTRCEQLGETNYMHKGCDIFGMPLDPEHPWNKERAASRKPRASN